MQSWYLNIKRWDCVYICSCFQCPTGLFSSFSLLTSEVTEFSSACITGEVRLMRWLSTRVVGMLGSTGSDWLALQPTGWPSSSHYAVKADTWMQLRKKMRKYGAEVWSPPSTSQLWCGCRAAYKYKIHLFVHLPMLCVRVCLQISFENANKAHPCLFHSSVNSALHVFLCFFQRFGLYIGYRERHVMFKGLNAFFSHHYTRKIVYCMYARTIYQSGFHYRSVYRLVNSVVVWMTLWKSEHIYPCFYPEFGWTDPNPCGSDNDS